jgi:hypothetical protein
MATKMNRTAKLAHYSARKRKHDTSYLSETTGYSVSHISNVLAGRRSVSESLANEMYKLSCRRQKNSELV